MIIVKISKRVRLALEYKAGEDASGCVWKSEKHGNV